MMKKKSMFSLVGSVSTDIEKCVYTDGMFYYHNI